MSDFTMVGMVGSSPVVIVASNHLAVKNIDELIDYGTKNPDKLSFATAGIGGAPHLAAKLFESRTGMKAIHVPYPGIAGAFGDLMAGNIQLAFSSIVGALPLTSENKIRALATTGSHRPAAYLDIPTLAEAVLPGFNVDIWLGLARAQSNARARDRAAQCRPTAGAQRARSRRGAGQGRYRGVAHDRSRGKFVRGGGRKKMAGRHRGGRSRSEMIYDRRQAWDGRNQV